MPEIRINDHKPDAPDADLEAETAAESASENEDQGDTVEQNDEPSGPVAVELDPIEKLEAEKAELLNHFQRAQAEFENFRKRIMREKDEAREYGAMETIRSLLPVADDFQRALDAEGLDPEVRKGLDLIFKSMFDVFTRAGLKPIEDNKVFDPNIHEAVDRGPAENDEDDQKILDVYQRGYHFKDRLLRPAMVKVAVKD
jgi:molecular chaperone GrpE